MIGTEEAYKIIVKRIKALHLEDYIYGSRDEIGEKEYVALLSNIATTVDTIDDVIKTQDEQLASFKMSQSV